LVEATCERFIRSYERFTVRACQGLCPANAHRSTTSKRLPEASSVCEIKREANRNEFVAALADEVFIAHATPGGHLETLAHRLGIALAESAGPDAPLPPFARFAR